MITVDRYPTIEVASGIFSKWHCAHLPIIYRFTNNLFPVNTVDPILDYIGVSADDGYALIEMDDNLLPADTYPIGSWITITGDDYDGVYQVISSQIGFIKINTPFVAYSSGTIQKFYNNYHIRVKVYVGIDGAHPLYANNPIEYRGAELIIPNLDGYVYFDAGPWCRAQLQSKDENAFADVVVNDTLAWTSFYIGYEESYDIIDTGEIETYISAETVLPDLYYAANAMLPFQDAWGGNLADYALHLGLTGRGFLTNATSLHVFSEADTHISAIIPDSVFADPVIQTIDEYDINGVYITTQAIEVTDISDGVYRIPLHTISLDVATDYFTIQLTTDGDPLTEVMTVKTNDACGKYGFPMRWLNNLGGWDTYVFKGLKEYEIKTERKTLTRDVYQNWPDKFITGDTIEDQFSVEAREITTVRSLQTKKDELDWIKELFYSLKVYQVRGSKLRTVLVDGRSLKLYRDRDKLYEMEFDIRPTDTLPVQLQ